MAAKKDTMQCKVMEAKSEHHTWGTLFHFSIEALQEGDGMAMIYDLLKAREIEVQPLPGGIGILAVKEAEE